MNQKITLRFADHVLTFVVPEEETSEITLAFRRKWPYKFTRADGDFHVNFDQVLWMKVGPGDEAKIGWEAVETIQEEVEEYRALFGSHSGTPSQPRSSGGKHGSL